MTLTLHPPERSTETLKALAASGSSLVAKEAQRQLRDRQTERLRREVGK